MMRSYALAAALLLSAGCALRAQDDFIAVTSYTFSVPLGDTRRFVTMPSWLGMNWEGAWMLTEHASAGLAFGVHDFNDASTGTTNFPSGSATGQQMRDLLVTTFMGTGRWYPLADRTHRPYIGLGAGVVYSDEMYTLGFTQTSRSAWHLAVAPEAGWIFPMIEGIEAMLTARFTSPVSTGEYIGGGPRRFPFATISIGLIER
jgi:hypothetical protein